MHLLLIRHGETEHNVAGVLAGVTDSKLTNHGVLQARRLGKFLAINRQLRVTRIFASDLQRAWMTGEEILKGQRSEYGTSAALTEVVRLALLREQDFGSFELLPWTSKRGDDAFTTKVPSVTDPDFKPKETAEGMRDRADEFLNEHVSPLLGLSSKEIVVIVSHGLFLAALWRALLGRFQTKDIFLGPDVGIQSPSRPLEYVGSWSNTCYLELDIGTRDMGVVPRITDNCIERKYFDFTLKVLAINRRDHLENLKRTRGIGSAAHDSRQQHIDGFFKRPRT